MCDKKVQIKFKSKIYKSVVKPSMRYGAECWKMRKNDAMLMNKTEMKMFAVDTRRYPERPHNK